MEHGSIGRTDLISPVDFSESVLRRSSAKPSSRKHSSAFPLYEESYLDDRARIKILFVSHKIPRIRLLSKQVSKARITFGNFF